VFCFVHFNYDVPIKMSRHDKCSIKKITSTYNNGFLSKKIKKEKSRNRNATQVIDTIEMNITEN
jgi:hypothetical protein